jgi:hypothetical protein
MPLLPLLLLVLLLPPAAVAGKVHHPPSFALDFFPGDGAIAQLALTGANATSAGAVSMRPPRARVQYRKPIRFAAGAGFSTYFSFSLRPSPPNKSRAAAASLAFFLAPAAPGPAAHAVSVAFDAADPTNIRIQIEFAGEKAGLSTDLPAGARKLHSWIEYNATSATLRVGLSASGPHGAPGSQLSQPLHLSALLRGGGGGRDKLLLAGFASAHANCTLFSWAFRTVNGPPYLMHSLPLDPSGMSTLATPPADRLHRAAASNRYHWVSLLLAAAAGAALTFVVLFVWYSMAARRPVAPVEYPMHPSSDDIVYEKIVLVGVKDVPSTNVASTGNK